MGSISRDRLKRNGDQWDVYNAGETEACGFVLKLPNDKWVAYYMSGLHPIKLSRTYGQRGDAVWAVRFECKLTRKIIGDRYLDGTGSVDVCRAAAINPLYGEAGGQTKAWWLNLMDSLHLEDSDVRFEWRPGPSQKRMDVYFPGRLVVEQKANRVELDSNHASPDYGTACNQVNTYREQLEAVGQGCAVYSVCNYREFRAFLPDYRGKLIEVERFDLKLDDDAFRFKTFLYALLKDIPLKDAADVLNGTAPVGKSDLGPGLWSELTRFTHPKLSLALGC
ncbi:hypothetical protein [Bifidobacterium callitrichidarum]|uniref:Uncharacterized protein n=1 Tax=Bifidobacterium callitrichidarum TaxID=2052941 RepID=A0A2U2NCG5_9BIFI|nr:hypothetical protein [Bifidobacterium callitrichidarum]PWG66778.1 hypothetical protein DF196_02425 [Bifidobacterium callitrichidarum]